MKIAGYNATPQARVTVVLEHPDMGRQAISVPVLEMFAIYDGKSNTEFVDLRIDPGVVYQCLQARIEQVKDRDRARLPRPNGGAHIDTTPFRERAHEMLEAENDESWNSIARRAGYFRKVGDELIADASPVKRALEQDFIGDEMAIRLAGALELDPVDLGF